MLLLLAELQKPRFCDVFFIFYLSIVARDLVSGAEATRTQTALPSLPRCGSQTRPSGPAGGTCATCYCLIYCALLLHTVHMCARKLHACVRSAGRGPGALCRAVQGPWRCGSLRPAPIHPPLWLC